MKTVNKACDTAGQIWDEHKNQIKAVAVGAGAVCLSAAAAAIPVPGVNSLLNLVPMWST